MVENLILSLDMNILQELLPQEIMNESNENLVAYSDYILTLYVLWPSADKKSLGVNAIQPCGQYIHTLSQ